MGVASRLAHASQIESNLRGRKLVKEAKEAKVAEERAAAAEAKPKQQAPTKPAVSQFADSQVSEMLVELRTLNVTMQEVAVQLRRLADGGGAQASD